MNSRTHVGRDGAVVHPRASFDQERCAIFLAALRRFLFVLAIALSATGLVHASATSQSEQAAADLSHRVDALQRLLDSVRDAKGEPLRQDAMQRHWDAMQGYMRMSLKRTVASPQPEAGDDAAGCQLAGGTWKALSFPGQMRSDDYLQAMQAHMGRMREEILTIHAAPDAAALDSALRAHWRDNYQALQRMRGLGWMFDGWKPVDPGDDARPPDPESDGARLAQAYCSVCHALPRARLHTAQEWSGVMATMRRHIVTSDTGTPLCIQLPSDDQLDIIQSYFTRYAR